MQKALNILHVEDDTSEAVLLREKLDATGYRNAFRITRTDCMSNATTLLKQNPDFNAVLLDLNLLDSAGMNSIRSIKNARHDLPIIVLTGISDEAAIGEALREGAQEYFIKGEEDGNALKRAIRYSIERMELESRLFEQATHDDLTGLVSRSLFDDRMEQAMARSDRSKKPFALLYLDLDGFKAINDTYGHGVGDKLLREVAKRLGKCVRNCDTVARLGGDEFAVILEDLSKNTHQDIERVLGRITMQIAGEPYAVQEEKASVGVSVGVAIYPDTTKNAGTLMKMADASMYEAKKSPDMHYSFAPSAT